MKTLLTFLTIAMFSFSASAFDKTECSNLKKHINPDCRGRKLKIDYRLLRGRLVPVRIIFPCSSVGRAGGC